MYDDLGEFRKKTNAFHDPYTLNKGWMFNFIVLIIVLLLIGTVVVSFIFEIEAALALFSISSGFVITMVVVFNLYKVFLPLFIPINQIPEKKQSNTFLYFIRLLTIVFSALMTVLLLTTWLSSPNIEHVRAQDLSELQTSHQEKLALIQQKSDESIRVITEEFALQAKLLTEGNADYIKDIKQNIIAQSQNAINGQTEGSRLRALKKLLRETEHQQLTKLTEISVAKSTRLAANKVLINNEKNIQLTNYHTQKELILKNNYLHDERVKVKIIRDFEVALNSFGIPLEYTAIVWLLAIITTIMIEGLSMCLSQLVGNVYSGGMMRHIQRKEHMDKTALAQMMKGTSVSAKEHGIKRETKSAMDSIIDEFEASTETFT